jgi:hypothetical protein
MMVKVLIDGYATGIFSSRKPAAENYPSHCTRSDFRALHRQELADLFVQMVRLDRECGLVKLGTVAVGGTKLKASATRHRAMSSERMVKAEAELKRQIDRLLNRARAADVLAKNEPERDILDIPGEIMRRQHRLAAITAAEQRLQQRQWVMEAAKRMDQERAGLQAVGCTVRPFRPVRYGTALPRRHARKP